MTFFQLVGTESTCDFIEVMTDQIFYF